MGAAAILGLLLAALLPVRARPQLPVLVDAIVAVVNGSPILLSQVQAAARFERVAAQLEPGQSASPAPEPAPTRKEELAALKHLEDEELILQARADEGFDPPPAAALQSSVDQQWRHWAQLAGGPTALEALLRRNHLARAEVEAQFRRQLAIVAFLDQRFGTDPEVTDVSAAAVTAYYERQFVPEARRHHLSPAPLPEVRATITTLLREQQRNAAEAQWLGQLRAAAQIEDKPW